MLEIGLGRRVSSDSQGIRVGTVPTQGMLEIGLGRRVSPDSLGIRVDSVLFQLGGVLEIRPGGEFSSFSQQDD